MPDTDPQPTPQGDAAPTQPPAGQPAQAAEGTDWKSEARKWEQRAKDHKKLLDEAAPKLTEYEQMVQASKTAEQRQSEELTRWQSEAETWRRSAVSYRVEALAGDFADAEDAVNAVGDPTRFLDAGGQIDEAGIRKELASILDRKPHFRRPDGPSGPRIPAPNRAQGSGGGGTPASSPAEELAAILRTHLGS